MQIQIQTFTLNKRFPLTISRGTTAQSTNIWLILQHDGIEGWGEASPLTLDRHCQTTHEIVRSLHQVIPQLKPFSPFDQQAIEAIVTSACLPSAAKAALDLAIHDWLGKRVGLPLWKLWGLDRQRIVPTSVTIGINTPEAARQRLLNWLQVYPVQAVKVKLGSPAGIDADQTMLQAVLSETSSNAKVSVDANGGWGLEDAIAMSHWLADQGITYIEQPLPEGQEEDLLALYRRSPLPIFVDESCFTSLDLPKLADRVHGINIKLMKSGGLTEAWRMIHTAQALGLQIMFGCYSDSALSNTAAVHLGSLATHLDLDSHLNLLDDPFLGAELHAGYLMPGELPGLGVIRR
jgi:L-alanine-DL-glutamate epimerase-like enolase superfamily enzyme